MKFRDYLEIVQAGEKLDREAAAEFLSFILDDRNLSDGQISRALAAFHKKRPGVEEICGFVDGMRARMSHIVAPPGTIDNCSTGGDKSGAFNISTASALLLAAGGVYVAKHGNRAATSKCGSADVLEALGISIDLEPEVAARYLADHHFVFLFAQLYHPALKRLATVRKQLGFPTVFNLLGPLLNPAGVKRQVVGTFSLANAQLLAQVMSKMDYEHAVVVTSQDGLDKASITAPVRILEVRGAEITKSTVKAGDYGLASATMAELAGGSAYLNAAITRTVLQPSKNLSAKQRIVVFNAGLGFYVAGKAGSIAEGIQLARDVLASGRGGAKLRELQTVDE